MQQILNSQDRNQAFLKFLLFFLITIILVVVAVYFNFRIPVKETNYYKTELEKKRSQDSAQARFIAKLEDVDSLFNKLDTTSGQLDYLPKQINDKLKELDDLKGNSNGLYNRSNKAISEKFLVLEHRIVDAQNAKSNPETITKLRKLLNQCIEDLKTLNPAIQQARQSELNSIEGMEIVKAPPGQ